MKRSILGMLAFSLLLGGIAVAGEQSSPADQVASIIKEFQDARAEFMTAYRAAETEEERAKLYPSQYPKAETYAPRLMAIAMDHPDDAGTVEALSWIVTNCQAGREKKAATKILIEDHIDSDALGAVCETMMYARDKEAEATLTRILENSSNRTVQGKACFSLASMKNRAGDSDEAVALFERVVAEYADVATRRGTLGKSAEGALFEARYLSPGKECPEISGEDIDGVAFNMSDYEGKVVFLDFWGNW